MKKWKYDLVQMLPGTSLLATLKSMGKDGWEAWHFDNERKVIFVKKELTLADELGITTDAIPPPETPKV